MEILLGSARAEPRTKQKSSDLLASNSFCLAGLQQVVAARPRSSSADRGFPAAGDREPLTLKAMADPAARMISEAPRCTASANNRSIDALLAGSGLRLSSGSVRQPAATVHFRMKPWSPPGEDRQYQEYVNACKNKLTCQGRKARVWVASPSLKKECDARCAARYSLRIHSCSRLGLGLRAGQYVSASSGSAISLLLVLLYVRPVAAGLRMPPIVYRCCSVR